MAGSWLQSVARVTEDEGLGRGQQGTERMWSKAWGVGGAAALGAGSLRG